MSKLITTRYEYVCFDDASGNLTAVPPTYPTVLDTYTGNAAISARDSYGTVSVSGAGLTTFQTAPGANVTIVAASTNTTFVNILTQAGVPVTRWLVGPGGTISFPGVWNTTGTLTAQACDTAFVLGAQAFNLQALWSA